jgi:hypothetical protein
LIRDKKEKEALEVIPQGSSVYETLMRAQLHLNLKQQKECVLELISFIESNAGSWNGLISLVMRLGNNYKLLDTP